ncbi:MAG: DUF721 domain-containing protein [Actinomycetales bacterium]|nr:MAG: DUF721 domain-containing protein [Actinomycetales bacterium]
MSDVPPGQETPDDEAPEQEPTPDPLGLARDVADSYRGAGRPLDPRRSTSRPRQASPRRAKREDPTDISAVLGRLQKDRGWDDRLAAQRVFTDWGSIVGQEVATHSKVVGFDDAIVHVETDSTAWATQLKLLAPRIVAKLNDELGDGSVLRIEIRGPQAPSWIKGKRTIRNARGPRDTYG